MDFKKSLFLITICTINIATPFSTYPKKEHSSSLLRLDINPKNTVFVFDLHDVVLKLSISKSIKSFFKLNNKSEFIHNIFSYFGEDLTKQKTLEHYVLTDQNNNSYKLAVINPHVPNPDTIQILKKLKAAGYQIYGCSNIGEQSYKYIQAKYPEVFSLFTACYTSQAQHNYIKKNNKQAFVNTVNMIENHAGFIPENILFVDNSQANLNLATQTDKRFQKIHFKNAYRLRKKLKRLHLL
jgi:FMN phosphatase YigB (HAD superfamily)